MHTIQWFGQVCLIALICAGTLPKRRRVDPPERPSAFTNPEVMQEYRTSSFRTTEQVLFINGRACPVNILAALPAALVTPEFGLLQDAAYSGLGDPQKHYVEVRLD